ncbi:uncharacterized protein BDR25DRAFT_347830 [Lindgomyces ingoldianus]|uniref:Uncharacterized protein n=1 Tax=Lindgomyces ingoldianus TaxID=673940 RepID=A0ACB6RDW9_9PLEO|nr:uncharacterized protein BDR25DRAFT_347830 [Lindgomyces ingoldianus]KAF2477478.1 hypothetical protein BDR25DRAFT_347830 [Lindgomyces ingoldianus]
MLSRYHISRAFSSAEYIYGTEGRHVSSLEEFKSYESSTLISILLESSITIPNRLHSLLKPNVLNRKKTYEGSASFKLNCAGFLRDDILKKWCQAGAFTINNTSICYILRFEDIILNNVLRGEGIRILLIPPKRQVHPRIGGTHPQCRSAALKNGPSIVGKAYPMLLAWPLKPSDWFNDASGELGYNQPDVICESKRSETSKKQGLDYVINCIENSQCETAKSLAPKYHCVSNGTEVGGPMIIEEMSLLLEGRHHADWHFWWLGGLKPIFLEGVANICFVWVCLGARDSNLSI